MNRTLPRNRLNSKKRQKARLDFPCLPPQKPKIKFDYVSGSCDDLRKMSNIQEEHEIVSLKRVELKNASFHLLAPEESLSVTQVLKTRTAADGNWRGKEDEILTETRRRVRTVRSIITNYTY